MKIITEKEFIITHLDNEAVLLNTKSGKYFVLNETGERIWELLQQHGDTQKVFTVMQAEYDVDKDVLLNDINNAILHLTDAGLLIPA